MPRCIREQCRIPLGAYRALRFGLILHPQFALELFLEGAAMCQTTSSKQHHGPRAVLNAAECLANSYRSDCDRVRQNLAIAEAQLRDLYQSRLGNRFPHESNVSELTA